MAQARRRVAAQALRCRHRARHRQALVQVSVVAQALHRAAVQVRQVRLARFAVAHRVAAAADNTLREYVSTAWHTPCYNLLTLIIL